MFCFRAWIVALALISTSWAQAQTFYYTGSFGGDFFNESNWNSLPGGGGASPLAGTIEPSIGYTLDLVIDGDNVTASGPDGFSLDIGAGGGLTLLSGSDLQVTNDFFNAQFELSTGATLNFTDAVLGVDDDIFLRGTSVFSGGTVETFADDLEFRSEANGTVTIVGTTFNVDDSIIFETEFSPATQNTITGATFNTPGRIGLRHFNVTVTDTDFVATGDVENVFTTDLDDATGTLTLLGESTLSADQVQEGVKLRLGGSSMATFDNVANDDDELSWFTQSSTVTLDSPDAVLTLINTQVESAAAKVINGVTGQTYASEPSTWNVATWNGLDGITLSITSVPSESDADFDGDNDVDGRDFLIWQRGYGLDDQTDNSHGDANGDGEVNGLDLADWQAQYGMATLTSRAAVPEPGTCALVLAAAGGLICTRSWCRFTL